MSEADEILFERRGRAGIITLNRPKALNAVTLGMVRAMDRRLREWAADDRIARVLIRAVPGRAFSAGGDIRAIHGWRQADDPLLLRFYYEEYRLNRRIKRYPKPYVALIDGIVMGGGVGVSIHGSHRVVGDSALFAMPETGIGFFPDVGGSHFLPRCPGETGLYLGLTGARIGPADMGWAGLATHAVASDRLEALADDLAGTADLDDALGAHAANARVECELSGLSGEIDTLFSGASLAGVLAALDASESEFAGRTRKTLAAKAPLSLRVAFRQLREGRDLDFEACMGLEYRLVSRFVAGHDFFEGIRAVVIDKDGAPRWRPAALGEVTDAMVEACFAPLAEELDFDD